MAASAGAAVVSENGNGFFVSGKDNMKRFSLRELIFLTLCCDLGLFTKRIAAPIVNLITDALHVPGGIGTGISLMFLVVAAALFGRFGCATIMGALQSVIALSLGMVGSMGALAPVGYIVPGAVIDLLLLLGRRMHWSEEAGFVLCNTLSSLSGALTADLIVFHLRGTVLLLYLSAALTSGAVCGVLGFSLAQRVRPIFRKPEIKENNHEK